MEYILTDRGIQLRLSVLNSTKTAYAAFVFESDTFFESYSFDMPRGSRASRTGRPDRFCCQLYIKVRTSATSHLGMFLALTFVRHCFRSLRGELETRIPQLNVAKLSCMNTRIKLNVDLPLRCFVDLVSGRAKSSV